MVPPSTGLPLAAWSAEADVGAARRNPVPYRGHRDVLRADAPPKARWANPNRMRAQLSLTARRLPRGFLWPRGNRGTPRYSMTPSRGAWRCKRGRGRSLPGRADGPRRWQARRAETGLAATVGYRHAAAAALDGKRKGVKGTLAALAAAPPVSHSEATDRPFQLSYPTPAPAARCGPGARSNRASRPRGPATRAGAASAARLDAVSDRVPAAAGDGAQAQARELAGARVESPRPVLVLIISVRGVPALWHRTLTTSKPRAGLNRRRGQPTVRCRDGCSTRASCPPQSCLATALLHRGSDLRGSSDVP